jgi:hypothetical protein
MSIAAAGPVTVAIPPKVLLGRSYDHWFFSTTALLMLTTVFAGFARSYYLAGVFQAPLPSLTIHLHGAAFTCWILLLVTQTSLVASGRVNIHRRLGIVGFLLACLMVALGVLAATDSLVRHGGPPGRDPRAFYIVPLTDMLIFGTLIFLAYRMRTNAAAHKRLILIATTALLTAAVARWPIAIVHRNPPRAALVTWVFLFALAAYDYWSTHKLHRVTIWASAFLITVDMIRIPIAQTGLWHSFAAWAQSTGR